ncbi:RHS repeat protein [Streptomyces sp. NBC_00264]|uniref:RHS repeat domain-containing protein n=1 Tax=unclassified Streptomyces TaxID=2593676 RepID=UPI00225B964C|nr:MULTISPECIES: RHS repeat-associated core domain-containing protein [unclassified Streptomyces]WSX01294.1 RHS repeat protein [Streptomyces sp. NBC_00987]MCX5160038.1 RHS repeat protein [Streptomyces sp. NBC_00305]MCX5218561.1 RHS repeat protein [Streptomyces sp. NBC_00264]WSC30411.1 RHS repeat protein [Streptomyces sp. NBC_01768]WSP49250.1 RHS repeat protein [Streptomyces sp. NBC_01243]
MQTIALSLVAYLLLALLGGPVAAAADLELQKLKKPDPVPVSDVVRHALDKPDETAQHRWKPNAKAHWPKAGSAMLDMPTIGKRSKTTTAGSLPVAIGNPQEGARSGGSPDRVQLQVLDRATTEAAGIDGVVIALKGHGQQSGKERVGIQIGYAGFAGMYGGDWASRLTLRQVSSCALTTPGKKGCAPGLAVKAVNDPRSRTLSAEVDTHVVVSGEHETVQPVQPETSTARSLAGSVASPDTTLFAVTAAPSGPTGNFTATSLAPSGKWSAGGSSGGFSWAYDIDTPAVPGGLGPNLGLTYSSQDVDGRTAATNNQANWIGDGWSMSPGFIERRYVACEDDKKGGNNTTRVGDQCWKTNNATLSMNGSSSELVKDDAPDAAHKDEWRKKDDDGTRVVLRKSADRGNGDNDGEYWVATTPDGTQYHFGYNRLPGWSSGNDETDSTWTVPVFGNHEGEDCHAAAFKDSWCRQAWRWNLDYVVDPHGNAMAYYWAKESNYYQRNIDPTTYKGTLTSYTRGGYLKRIEYGLRSDRVYADKAIAKVDFTVAERCLRTDTFDCATEKFSKANAKNWPDTPFDQSCAEGATCEGNSSPTYFSRKRLTQIATSALVGGAYKKADSWALTQEFRPTGDGTDPPLWLTSIARTGHTAGDATLPPVTFKGQQLPNRVEGAVDPVPAYNRYRVYAIETESGGTIGVTYSEADCKAGSLPSPSANTKRCYPVIWSPPDAPAGEYKPYTDWFHSYVVTQMLESDNVAGAPVKRTDYSYPEGLAWAKDDDELTKAEERTYGARKGYGRVQTRTGDPAQGVQSLTETRYFRGISGAKVADGEGNALDDHEAFAGMVREEATYNGSGGALVSATSYTPWHSSATATHARADNLPTVYAYRTAVQKEQTRTTIDGGKLRRTETQREFDSYGRVKTLSESGDTAKSGDEQCTTASYARNVGANILDLVAESKVVAKPCGTAPSLPADLVSTKRYFYDSSTTLGAEPAKGDETRRDENDGKGTGFVTVNEAGYDKYGRQTSATDVSKATITTKYDPPTGQSPNQTIATNIRKQDTTTITDPVRGVTTAAVDANGKRADIEYDALGRVIKVWEPGWSRTTYPKLPSTEYTYSVTKSKPSVVTAKTLQFDGSYASTYTFYDGLLRPRETQAPAVGASDGRLVTETLYDTRGLAWKTYAPYYSAGAPSSTLASGDDSKVPAAVENLFDGAARTVASISRKFGDETKRTTYAYGGDRTTVIPPAGGTATTTIEDALGRKSELRTYTNAQRTEFQTSVYEYDKHGGLAKMTDPAGSWIWGYDARGRQTSADDPDKGTTRTEYDDADRPRLVADARGIELTTTYDELGRRKELKQGSVLRASWMYDTIAEGQLTSSTRYMDGKAYTTQVDSYDDRYQPTSTTTTLPDSAGALAGSYTWTYGYNQYTGAQEWVKHPAVGDLPSERQTTVYGQGDLPQKTTVGSTIVVNATSYDVFSRPVRTEFGTLGHKVYNTQRWDEHTGELTGRTLDGDEALRIEDTKYSYDAAGNTTRISSTSGQDTAAVTDTQCFGIDAQRRMTEAWTTKNASDDCTNGPSATTVGGPDAYWHSYEYDMMGNRTKETQHAVTTGASDVTRTYTPGAPGDNPHALRSVSTTGGPDNGKTEKFTYDDSGNTESRKGGSREQGMIWDAEGNLDTVAEGGKTTSYVYDPDGNRILARNADGTTTAYLPGGNELTATSAGVKTAARYYTHGGETVAVRTKAGISLLFGDQQGTALVAVAMGVGQLVTRRKQLPFGGVRSSTATSWPGSHGFVDGTTDPTGLTHLGAREYDPTLGRFISVDPLLVVDDPVQHNAYQYGSNNPATYSDPTGENSRCYGGNMSASCAPPDPPKSHCYTGNMSASCTAVNPDHNSREGRRRSAELAAAIDAPRYCYGGSMSASCSWNKSGSQQQSAAQNRASELKHALEQQKSNEREEGFWKGVWKNSGGRFASGVHNFASVVGDFAKDHWRGIAQAAVIIVGGVAVTICTAATAGVCAGAGGIIMSAAIGATQGIATYGLSGGEHSAEGYVQSASIGAATAGGATALAKAGMLMSPTSPYHSVSTMTSSARVNGGRFWKGGLMGRQVRNHMGFGTKWADR